MYFKYVLLYSVYDCHFTKSCIWFFNQDNSCSHFLYLYCISVGCAKLKTVKDQYTTRFKSGDPWTGILTGHYTHLTQQMSVISMMDIQWAKWKEKFIKISEISVITQPI